MNSEDIKALIKRELESEPNIGDILGYNLQTCLIDPVQHLYKDSTLHLLTYEMCTVFEEREDGKGYYVYFDEKAMVFGLALKSKTGTMIKVGEYGSLIRTLYSI